MFRKTAFASLCAYFGVRPIHSPSIDWTSFKRDFVPRLFNRPDRRTPIGIALGGPRTNGPTTSSISGAPTVLPSDTNGAKFATCAGRGASAGIKLHRVVAIHRKRKGQACARVRLCVIRFHAI